MDYTPTSSELPEPEHTNSYSDDLNELVEYLRTYFNGTRTPLQAWQLFEKEQSELRDQLLADPNLLGEYLEKNPHYVAAALFGMVKFRNCTEVRKLCENYTQVTIDELREAKCLTLDPSIRSFLGAISQDKLLKVLALCALTEKNSQLKIPARP